MLMDVRMPGIDGSKPHAAFARWKKQRRGRTPIIALTANALPEDREACLAAGMDGFLQSRSIARNWPRCWRVITSRPTSPRDGGVTSPS